MKTLNKIFCSAVAVAMLAACSNECPHEPETETVNLEGVYFSLELASNVNISAKDKYVDVTVSRMNADETQTVAIYSEAPDIFTVPASVTFPAGEKWTDLRIAFDPAAIEIDEKYPIALEIASADDTTPYGASYHDFTICMPSTWSLVGTGNYWYTVYFVDEDEEPVIDPGLELWQNDNDPTRYKIEHWGYDVDFYFTMDENGRIVVDDQFTGDTDPDYGPVWVDEFADYSGDGSVYSEYEDGVFWFAVIYYVDAGYFGFDYEWFELTELADNSSSAVTAVKKSVASKQRAKLPAIKSIKRR